MSEAEKYEAQGRAHAHLKEAKANAATLHTSLQHYITNLEETASYLKVFLLNPLDESGHISAAEQVKADYRNLHRSSFGSDVDQLVLELKRARDLQQQIEKF